MFPNPCYSRLIDKFVFLEGIFGECREATDLDLLRKSCEFDLCTTLPDEAVLCTNLENLASVCRQGGVEIGNWRAEVTQCSKYIRLL